MATAVAPSAPALDNLKKMLAEPSATGAPAESHALSPAAVTAAKEVRRDGDDNTSGKRGREYKDADAVGRRRARYPDLPSFFSQDVFDRFGAPTSVGRLLGLMEDAAALSGPRGLSFTARRGWPVEVAKEDDDAVYVKMSMPGLGKEHVKVWAEKNSLMIKGEGEKEPWDGDKDDDAVPKYSRRIEMPADAFKMDKIKAEMKDGVLRVTVPKLKKEERKDVFQVQIE